MTTLQAMLRAERAARLAAEAEVQTGTLLIAKLKLRRPLPEHLPRERIV